MAVPRQPKLYHIVHWNRLSSIVGDGYLYCDAHFAGKGPQAGTGIGMPKIKQRRLSKTLASHPNLCVGQCVPFYFCSRSVMLYLIHQGNNPDLQFKDGQEPIVHLEADMHAVVRWANTNARKWAFTLTNAGSTFFEDRSNLECLDEVDWKAVEARDWRSCKDGKQAEFLVQECFPWHLVERIGVENKTTYREVVNILPTAGHRPAVEVIPAWYY